LTAELAPTAAPNSIVSLLSSATEMLFALGLGNRVVAVSHECDWPAEATQRPRATFSRVDSSQGSGAIDDQVKAMLASGETLYGIDAALLADLQPDLIVTQAQCDVCAVRYADVVDLVSSIPALTNTKIVALNPMSLADVLNDIRQVAEAAGVAVRGEEVVAQLSHRIAKIQRATESLSLGERPRTALIEWTNPIMLAGNWMPELLALAGGQCSLTAAGSHSGYITWDKIVAFDPEVIVIAPCGFDLPRSLAEAASLPALEAWKNLSAVRRNRVYVADGNAYFNRSGPRLVDSLEILAHLLHPERVPPPTWTQNQSPPWQSF
jgi:iron complex transport system substrate-binding protein